ncbi:MAG TPA: sigma-70 family RNA polymerase sigma factor [Saprospiraceae bacterium]|nr:sigma-70 family RNA polymerase sigma factor [Saprospiraceae bacterium]MCB9327709.1 sigma-70 family RNA polymerase sigma factor [Lewinellaceae bacterium]HRX29969.1 sigma-70 family RNA polymerase sigma factor [Saprospiraceae bacterium]
MNFDLENIIKKCQANDRLAQNQLYEHYKGILYSISLRYMGDKMSAEDAFVEAFFKIFDKINDYQGAGSFEGWMKKITVNECLMSLRKKNNLRLAVELADWQVSESPVALEILNMEDLAHAIEELPPGYRTIFNMYEIDGFKHREIADELGISINTSKSQLILAKKRLREIIKKKQTIKLFNSKS